MWLLVLKEKILRFLPYMGMAAILAMLPGTFILTFIPPSMKVNRTGMGQKWSKSMTSTCTCKNCLSFIILLN